jgi:hypothetical protein
MASVVRCTQVDGHGHTRAEVQTSGMSVAVVVKRASEGTTQHSPHTHNTAYQGLRALSLPPGCWHRANGTVEFKCSTADGVGHAGRSHHLSFLPSVLLWPHTLITYVMQGSGDHTRQQGNRSLAMSILGNAPVRGSRGPPPDSPADPDRPNRSSISASAPPPPADMHTAVTLQPLRSY